MFRALLIATAAVTLSGSVAYAADAQLEAAVKGPARGAAHVARDVHRHPVESLTFWGLKPGLTVVEVQPGSGYWTEILAPYAKATGGKYIATAPDVDAPNATDAVRTARQNFEARYADEAKFGKVSFASFGPASKPLGPPGSADLVITARNIHNWLWSGMLDKAMADFYAVLKPGGVLAVEEHRADPRPETVEGRDGYLSVATVRAAAEKAGFRLVEQSNVNANPKDTKDHVFGVWTLPPYRAKAFPAFTKDWPGRPADATYEPAKYEAIGESDRMTLRFVKPG